MSYSSWISNGTNVAYEPKEKNTGEVITPFSTTAPGGVPNSSYAPSTYVLAASGAWIAQTAASAASEVRRPSVYTELTGNPSPYFIATNTNLVYDADANHITTYGAFELAGLQVLNDASFTYTVFQTKAQTWTSCTLNISRNYASTQWTSGTEARFYLSTDSGANWTLLLTDDYDSDPITVAIFSHTLATVNPSSLSAYQVKVEIDAYPSAAFNSVGVLYLQLYDIWIEGIYAVSGGSGTVTSVAVSGANGVGVSGSPITTSGTIALSLGAITPTSIVTGTGSFSGDVEFASSIKSPNASNSPIVIAPDGTGDLHVNADSMRLGDNNSDATIATRGTGDLIITTNEGSGVEGIVRLYDGANGNITLTPNGTGQVKVGTDQVVTLIASQTLTNKSISGSANTLSNIANASLTNSTISGVSLGSNLNALTISSPLTGTSFNGSAAVSIGIPVATTSANGYLSSTDWTTFNNKGSGTVTSVTGTSPVVSSGGTTPAISIPVATTSVSGYLSSTDWTTFNNKGSGSVTSVAATVPSLLSISGSPITTSGTLAITYSGTALPVANGGTGLTTLTAGYIPYGAGTSAFGSSANLFWDSANSRLGIGTASPVTKLNILGSTAASGELGSFAISGSTTAKRVAFGVDSTGTMYGWVQSVESGVGYQNLNLQPLGGNLGVGTTSAADKLHVEGNIYLGTTSRTIYQGGSANLNLQVNTGEMVFLRSNGSTESMRLTSTGLGIGTASPRAKLDVSGDIYTAWTDPASTFIGMVYVAGADYRNGLLLTGSGRKTGIVSKSADNTGFIWFGTGSAETERMRIDSSGNVGIGTASPTAKLTVSGTNTGSAIDFTNTTASTGRSYRWVSTNSGGFAVEDNTASGAERMRIDSSGNVGIGGTASEGNRLYVVGSNTTSNTSIPIYANQTYGNTGVSSAAIRMNLNGGSGGGYLYGYSGDAGFMHNAEYLSGSGWTARSTFASVMQTTSAGFLFHTNSGLTAGNTFTPSERMRIDSSGNVGIGTASPTNKLQVNGVMVGNNAAGSYTKGFGGILTTTSTSTPTGGSSGDFTLIY